MGKKEQIRDYLLQGNIITGIIALELFGAYRLSSYINRLRNEGLPIKTVMVESSEGKTIFAKYFIPISERVNMKKDGES